MQLDEFMALPDGVRMIVTQGNLDHWFNADLWGKGSSIRPSDKAFAKAIVCNLIEAHATRPEYRLTNLGRILRHQELAA